MKPGWPAEQAGPVAGTAPVEAPYYQAAGNEVDIFEHCHANRLAVMLKGPTGCGKTRFVEYMAWRLGRPLITVACHDDLSVSDLVGRFLVQNDSTVWQDGPLTRAVREGAICYLDEVVEARQDTVVVIHSLTDHRRLLPVDKTGELLEAAEGFQLVVSYNPGYQHLLKDFKPSTRQRFVALEFEFPSLDQESGIVAHESGLEYGRAHMLVTLAHRMRKLEDRGLTEVPSTRLLVATAKLMVAGVAARDACRVALVSPLTDDPEIAGALEDLMDIALQ